MRKSMMGWTVARSLAVIAVLALSGGCSLVPVQGPSATSIEDRIASLEQAVGSIAVTQARDNRVLLLAASGIELPATAPIEATVRIAPNDEGVEHFEAQDFKIVGMRFYTNGQLFLRKGDGWYTVHRSRGVSAKWTKVVFARYLGGDLD